MPSNSNNPLLPDAAVQAIQDSVKTAIITVDERDFTTRHVFDPPADPVPVAIALNTLSGLVAYIEADIDGAVAAGAIAIHVVSEGKVTLISGIFGRSQNRKCFAGSVLESLFGTNTFQFGKFYDLEEFNIKLRTLFDQSAEREELLRLLGNIKEERVRTTEDDGISQTVIARVGIASVAEVRVPSPVTLRPYRTFREIWQPASPFIVRLRPGDEDELPTVALFEADGGQWKLEAINLIAEYFKDKVEGVHIFA
jgi:hypothetical protein